jgi:hypothetical protein
MWWFPSVRTGTSLTKCAVEARVPGFPASLAVRICRTSVFATLHVVSRRTLRVADVAAMDLKGRWVANRETATRLDRATCVNGVPCVARRQAFCVLEAGLDTAELNPTEIAGERARSRIRRLAPEHYLVRGRTTGLTTRASRATFSARAAGRTSSAGASVGTTARTANVIASVRSRCSAVTCAT